MLGLKGIAMPGRHFGFENGLQATRFLGITSIQWCRVVVLVVRIGSIVASQVLPWRRAGNVGGLNGFHGRFVGQGVTEIVFGFSRIPPPRHVQTNGQGVVVVVVHRVGIGIRGGRKERKIALVANKASTRGFYYLRGSEYGLLW